MPDIQPISALVSTPSANAWSYYICNTYPSSCWVCPSGWSSSCKKRLSSRIKFQRRAEACPLFKPEYVPNFGMCGERMLLMLPMEILIQRNPIFMPGVIVLVKTPSRVRTKIGDGVRAFNDISYIFSADDTKNHKGGLVDSDVLKISDAINIIKDMWSPPSGGFIENGQYYQYIDFIYTKKECLDALEIVKKFIEEFAPDVKNDE